jgi:hypothetical protein
LDHSGQGLLGHAPWFKKAGEVTALAELRDPQLDSARTGLPVTIAEAVALVDAFGGAFGMASAAERCAAKPIISRSKLASEDFSRSP